MKWLIFIQERLLPWAPIAAILGIIAYEAFFVCLFGNACSYPVRSRTLGEPYQSSYVDYNRGCGYAVRNLPTCE